MHQPKYLQRTQLALALLGCFAAQYSAAQLSVAPPPITSYPGDPGTLGDPQSWKTSEFLRDWGMQAIDAQYAYAAGYAGSTMSIGVVDSGYAANHVAEHEDRYFAPILSGGTTGPTPGFWNSTFNNGHGTHVSGTVGAARDGRILPVGANANVNMHGVAFEVDLYMGNHRKTDGVFYGVLPANVTDANTLDNAYMASIYHSLNSMPVRPGHGPIRVITSSWGSQPNTENYNTYETPPTGPQTFGLKASWRHLVTPDGVADINGKTTHWIWGAIDVARTGTIIQFTAGNGGYANTTPRGSATYFMPELEGRWYTTSSITLTGQTFNADGSILVPGQQTFNRCGVAKWGCVTAPGQSINSTTATSAAVPTYGSSSGTSMAGPHSAAELVLIMQRFPYMTNEQALYTMFTTARQNNTINNAAGAAMINPDRGTMVQVPDARNGWGTPNLKDAFRGPGQFLGRFALNTAGYSDVWSNNISDVAFKQRKLDDQAEAATWNATKVAKGWTKGLPANASVNDQTDFTIGMAREQARATRVYPGSLTKSGAGTLFLTGNNTYSGGSTAAGGKLSILGTNSSGVAISNGGTLSGTGTILGAISVLNGGVLWPGLTAAEAATITTVPVAAGDVLRAGLAKIGLGGGFAATLKAGGASSRLVTTGMVALGGTLFLDVAAAPNQGDVYTLIQAGSIAGTFSGMPEGTLFMAGGNQYRISYLGNAVTVTATNPGAGTS